MTSVNRTRSSAYNNTPAQVSTIRTPSGDSVFNYQEIYNSADTESSAPDTVNNTPSADSYWSITMGQTQNFTFAVAGLNNADPAFTMPKRNGMFLPLKSMDYKPISLESMKIKAGVFSDLPFFHRKKLGTINCVMHDSDKGKFAVYLLQWYNSCVSSNGYVPFVEDMCKKAIYTEYTHDGKISNKYEFLVIPDNDLSTNRVYDNDGALTEFRFTLIMLSPPKICKSGRWVEADWGDGTGPDADYERRVHGNVMVNSNGIGTIHVNDPAIADTLR